MHRTLHAAAFAATSRTSSPVRSTHDDRQQRRNFYAEHPELVAEPTALLRSYVENGRSTPGPNQQNDVPIDLRITEP